MTTYDVGRIVNPAGTLVDQRITVSGDRIVEVAPIPRSSRGLGIDPSLTAVPGFIDLHTHGGAGHDVMDGESDDFAAVAAHHLRTGTTSFLGNTLTAPLGQIETILDGVRNYLPVNKGAAEVGREAEILGIHLEGPWISHNKAGAQNSRYIRSPDSAAMEFVHKNSDVVRIVTFSYHHPNSPEFLRALLDAGVVPACGHDDTTDEQVLDAFSRGLSYITHLYSMSGSFTRVDGRKHLGSVEMALMTPGVSVEVIADGHHITEYFWRFIRHNKDVRDIVIVSDSMRWAGLPADPNEVITMGGVEVIVDDGVAWLADRSAYAGSVSSMHDMFRRLVREWGVPMEDAVRMTSQNQAGIMGIGDRLGSIEPGMQADFLVLDSELEINEVIKAGVSTEGPGSGDALRQ